MTLNEWTHLLVFIRRSHIKSLSLITLIDFCWGFVLGFHIGFVIAVFVVGLERLIHKLPIGITVNGGSI